MTQAQKETDTQRKLLSKLKGCNPHRVLVYASDDDDKPRAVAVPTRRRKWSTVIAQIESKPWVRVVCVDKAGDELGFVDNDGAATELEDIGHGMPAGLANQLALGERIAQMCQLAADRALAARQSEVTAILNAQRGVMESMGVAFNAQTQALLTLADVKEQAANTRAEADIVAATAANKGELEQLLEALPTLMQAMPLLKGLLANAQPKH